MPIATLHDIFENNAMSCLFEHIKVFKESRHGGTYSIPVFGRQMQAIFMSSSSARVVH